MSAKAKQDPEQLLPEQKTMTGLNWRFSREVSGMGEVAAMWMAFGSMRLWRPWLASAELKASS